jgi:UDP-glucose:(heptosyl)LPS alpha-1,3-glucosyltransferase
VVEFAKDQENALVVDADDPRGLESAIVDLHVDETLRERLSIAGRATAQDLTWRAVASRYEVLYEKIQRDTGASWPATTM